MTQELKALLDRSITTRTTTTTMATVTTTTPATSEQDSHVEPIVQPEAADPIILPHGPPTVPEQPPAKRRRVEPSRSDDDNLRLKRQADLKGAQRRRQALQKNIEDALQPIMAAALDDVQGFTPEGGGTPSLILSFDGKSRYAYTSVP